MASLLRHLVAGPRSRHPEANLDLCYVTSQIIATSGPSATYPQRAYRNPLDQLVKFLDLKHGEEWAIWEFRAEGTGYPDEAVYGRIRHYPWPDHHPPPFRIVPGIMASMRNWLKEEVEDGDRDGGKEGKKKKKRVVVVHCKAGKGRSGTVSCAYLISECGWSVEDALARFTERRMRPGFGPGVSIPSQRRWIGYVDRWTKGGKVYVDREIEVSEVHVWGLRAGVKVQIEGFVDEGKMIKLFHVFSKKERVVVDGDAPGSKGFADLISDMAGLQNSRKKTMTTTETKRQKTISVVAGNGNNVDDGKQRSSTDPNATAPTATATTPAVSVSGNNEENGPEPGGGAVIFKPLKPVILPTSDINIDFERRNKASYGFTMVTSVAHVWFNAFFEGNGPEQGGKPDSSGVFEIDWDDMDGIKGSSRKGTRAFDRLAVIWKVHEPGPGEAKKEEVIHEPGIGSPVPQLAPADWHGANETSPGIGKDLGLRIESPASAEVSKASSIKSQREEETEDVTESESVQGVKTSGPTGEEDIDVNGPANNDDAGDSASMSSVKKA
ncbi:putative phosphatidylinositol-3,4,5-trisphosphate 3-phosphatase [Xylogone sp. PMI_703]|nr:putative phosphatidylinositol-3,4,5-trisphosphate 3-phosphatase [Xylogone sp. PMI_703]